jgi:hypothetical protein
MSAAALAARTWLAGASASASARTAAGIGASVLAVAAWASWWDAALPIPVAATAVIVFSAPRSPAARLNTILGTHAACGAIGLLLGALLPVVPAAGAAAAMAAWLMLASKRMHVPAALTAVATATLAYDAVWLLGTVLPCSLIVWAIGTLTVARLRNEHPS